MSDRHPRQISSKVRVVWPEDFREGKVPVKWNCDRVGQPLYKRKNLFTFEVLHPEHPKFLDGFASQATIERLNADVELYNHLDRENLIAYEFVDNFADRTQVWFYPPNENWE